MNDDSPAMSCRAMERVCVMNMHGTFIAQAHTDATFYVHSTHKSADKVSHTIDLCIIF